MKSSNLLCPLTLLGAVFIEAFHPSYPLLSRSSRSSFSFQSSSPTAVVDEQQEATSIPEQDPARIREETISQNLTIDSDNAFDVVASRACVCLFESDVRRDAIGKGAGKQASSATNWIDDASAFALQQTLNKFKLKLANERTGIDRDQATSWIQWLKSTPSPALIDLSDNMRQVVNATLTTQSLDWIDQKRSDVLSRLVCRLILLPSGAELATPLLEPSASIICGKLLYGGVTRYRLLHSSNSKSPPRRAGARSAIKATTQDNVAPWIQYGGPERMLEAVDMGPAAIMEVILLPRGRVLETSSTNNNKNMVIQGMTWKPQDMFDFVIDDEESINGGAASLDNDNIINGYSPASLSGRDRNQAFQSDFRSSVGGLQPQIDSIVRRVLDGRVIRPAQDDDENDDDSIVARDEADETHYQLRKTAVEAQELSLLGLTPVRGLLLYGPPGCGKTALAREISRALRARTPKIVSAPELLDRWVGGSERLVRELFADAEAELRMCDGDATKSALHVVVIDEIDAVFRKRSSAEDSGEATRSSVVNQILAKLDGVNAIPNVLLIGMTNRRELLDEALLRPGRLEVQIEIPKPDREGRREILQIHFGALRERGRLSQPLCCAIDGVRPNDNSYTSENEPVRGGGKRQAIRRAVGKVVEIVPSAVRPTYDLAADSVTGGFSGADIAGLVRCAGSIALARCRTDGNGVEGLLITLEDVKQALNEVQR